MTKPPFPTLPKTTLAKGAAVPEGFGPKPFDILKCEITDDQIPESRILKDSKYKQKFESLPPNKRLKVPHDQVENVAKALRKHITQCMDSERFTVRSVKDYKDGFGGVWLIELPKKLKAVA